MFGEQERHVKDLDKLEAEYQKVPAASQVGA
jgi:hypothetical protein